jgi:hypothetical protein
VLVADADIFVLQRGMGKWMTAQGEAQAGESALVDAVSRVPAVAGKVEGAVGCDVCAASSRR